ncbi:hypothetical protein PG994_010965 [Apiospora phragmitis]|uniref:Large ribosomal subunit protein mL67 n=1 Tax=Apiospora phragmitis TaxID=2905665 RepID=A0ABR1TTQ9_9PEZI
MNLSPLRSITEQLSRLSVSISRAASARPASTSTVRAPAATKKQKVVPEKKLKEVIPTKFEPGHGEKIWIFTNFISGLTVYSHNPVLKPNRALRQIPFNGKKLKPSKIRKDYWRPMAMIQFTEGQGHVGRSVYHIMRELRMRHDLGWDDSMIQDKESGRTLTRHERGQKLNGMQKPNAIADIAAVLGGLGKGNKMWQLAAEGVETDAEASRTDEKTGVVASLLKTQVWWMDPLDKNYAESWSPNVSHYAFNEASLQPVESLSEKDVASQEAQIVPEDRAPVVVV